MSLISMRVTNTVVRLKIISSAENYVTFKAAVYIYIKL